MQSDALVQSGAPVKTGAPVFSSATGGDVRPHKGQPISDFLAKSVLFGAAFLLPLSSASTTSVDWYAKATLGFDPASYSDFLATRERPRVLTRSEQAVLHRALRRSARMVHKAKRALM